MGARDPIPPDLDEALRELGTHVERRRLLPRQQMRVAGQRESRRVVTKGAAELEEVGAASEVERGEGMAERVEASPGRSCLPHERLENSRPQVGRVERSARFAGKEDRRRVLVGLAGEVGSESCCQRVGQADLAAAVLRLRRLDPAADQGAADADLGLAL